MQQLKRLVRVAGSGAKVVHAKGLAHRCATRHSASAARRHHIVAAAFDAEGQHTNAKVFAEFIAFSPDGAMKLVPVAPTFKAVKDGAWGLNRAGGLLTIFAPPDNTREGTFFKWQTDMFAMRWTPQELAAVMAEPQKEHTIVRNPYKGQDASQKQVHKTLKWLPEGDGYVITVTEQETGTEGGVCTPREVAVSLTKADLFILRALVAYQLPRMFGFDLAEEYPGQ